jgi:hypothetical protein
MPACKSCQTPIDRMQAAASIFDMRSTFIMGRKAMSRAAKDRAAAKGARGNGFNAPH